MLDSIITSDARIKLLLRFFVNPDSRAYLRELAGEFACSSNSIRVELNRMVESALLKTDQIGRNVYYQANREHPLYPEIRSMSRKMVGIDKLDEIVKSAGKIEQAYLTGDLAKGHRSEVVDLVLVGSADRSRVDEMIEKVEKVIKRRIRSLLLTKNEFNSMQKWLDSEGLFLIWDTQDLGVDRC